MDTVKQKQHSIRTALIGYIPVCLAAILIGSQGIRFLLNLLRASAVKIYPVVKLTIHNNQIIWSRSREGIMLFAVSHADYVLLPVWVLLCILVTGYFFYSRELREPIEILTNAAKQISENELDFKVQYRKNNELGTLCSAFDEMRQKLFESNLEIWQSMEERKRLSAAFSHDLRTPLTVLSGYVELMQKYEGQLPPAKQTEILQKMERQINRLRQYTEQMNAVQKLEDITPKRTQTTLSALHAQLAETGSLLCEAKQFHMKPCPHPDQAVPIDAELVMQVFENLAANALRYANTAVTAEMKMQGDFLCITVQDDGCGFTEEALRKADRPFYREEGNSDVHFGLGLYICRLLCMKHGGKIRLANAENGGGKVTAEFYTANPE